VPFAVDFPGTGRGIDRFTAYPFDHIAFNEDIHSRFKLLIFAVENSDVLEKSA
jgi:hypothetical protein